MGSLVLSSFVLGVVYIYKVIFHEFEKVYDKAVEKSPIFKCICCCFISTNFCLNNYLKYMNKNVYTHIAMHGDNFNEGCKRAFYLSLRHRGHFPPSSMIGGIMSVTGKAFIITLNSAFSIALINEDFMQVQ